MKRNTLMAAAILAASVVLAADPKDTVTAAAKKLADGGNYSWKQTVDMGGGGGFGGGGPMVSQGKTQSGLTWTSMEIMDNTIERLAKGTNSVTKNQEGQWQTQEEMAAARGGGGGGGGRRGFGGRGGGMFGAANALPASTALELASQTTNLKEADGVISGDLTEDGAKAQLSFGRRGGRGGAGGGGGMTPPEPTNAKGSVKFWVKDGVLSKYELKTSGTMTFGDNEMQMDRTTTVEFSNVGSTKVDAPAEAIKKIEG